MNALALDLDENNEWAVRERGFIHKKYRCKWYVRPFSELILSGLTLDQAADYIVDNQREAVGP